MTMLAEYIWIDGIRPTPGLRSKTRVCRGADLLAKAAAGSLRPEDFPRWSADGSSTGQATGDDSDILLEPVRVVPDPFRRDAVLVLCEVLDPAGASHPSNSRAALRRVLGRGAAELEPMFGFEQEYTLMRPDGTPLGFPRDGFPAPQGPYYCGVGASRIAGRRIYEAFLGHALRAELGVTGVNFEVMPGQAEVQVAGGALEAADGVWLARFILARTAEDFDVDVSFDPKPAAGDWNGAGMHTNFSTAGMREDGGFEEIVRAVTAMSDVVEDHLAVYGEGFERRLTGAHETCSHEEFRWGVADRTASVRVPLAVARDGRGYFEDRRPNANADPYLIAERMLETVLAAARSSTPTPLRKAG